MVSFVFDGKNKTTEKGTAIGEFIKQSALEESVLCCKVNGETISSFSEIL